MEMAGSPAVMEAEALVGPVLPARDTVAVFVYIVPATGAAVCLKSIQTVPACAPAIAALEG